MSVLCKAVAFMLFALPAVAQSQAFEAISINIVDKDCILDTGTPGSCHNFIVGRGHPLNARAINMDDLAQYIENWTDLPVVNRTAVGGAVRRRDGRLDSHAAAASSARQPAGRELRRRPHNPPVLRN